MTKHWFRRQAKKIIIRRFHQIYYNAMGQTWLNTRWLGVTVEKLPLDLWIYQEILFETRPDLIIETGTRHGGSAYFLATVCDLLNQGRIVTIDVDAAPPRPQHPRIEYLGGSSTDPTIVRRVKQAARECESVLVILDSDHSRQHVLDELKLYGPLVSPGNYLIVEDINLNGHPVYPEHGPGPMEALEEFLAGNDDFSVDSNREKFLVSFNPRDYLRKKA